MNIKLLGLINDFTNKWHILLNPTHCENTVPYYRAINCLQKYFLNPVYYALCVEGNVGLRDGHCPYTFQNFVGVCVYTGKVVTKYEGNMNMGQYYS